MDMGVADDGIEELLLELSDRLQDVRAPGSWTGPRAEAWLDWAEGEADVTQAIAAYAEALTLKAQAKGLVKDVRARTRSRDEPPAARPGGLIAIGASPPAPAPRVLDAADPRLPAALESFVAAHRGRAAARSAAARLSERLQAVIDSVLRCEGDAAACADLQKNASLARAAEAARIAGAGDAMILDAIALARAGAGAWRAEAPLEGGSLPQLVVAASPRALTG